MTHDAPDSRILLGTLIAGAASLGAALQYILSLW